MCPRPPLCSSGCARKHGGGTRKRLMNKILITMSDHESEFRVEKPWKFGSRTYRWIEPVNFTWLRSETRLEKFFICHFSHIIILLQTHDKYLTLILSSEVFLRLTKTSCSWHFGYNWQALLKTYWWQKWPKSVLTSWQSQSIYCWIGCTRTYQIKLI